MNLKLRVVLVALIAAIVSSCSLNAAPPSSPEQPTAPTATPSHNPEAPTEPASEPEPEPNTSDKKDVWVLWSVPESEKNEGAADAAAEYGLVALRTAKDAPFESIGLLEGEKCIVFFSLPAIAAEWPMNLTVMERLQPPNTDQFITVDHDGIKNEALAKFAIQTSGEKLNCFA